MSIDTTEVYEALSSRDHVPPHRIVDETWLFEPDFRSWYSKTEPQLHCVLRRSVLLTWCGYVEFPPGSHDGDYTYYMDILSVHGGVSWEGALPECRTNPNPEVIATRAFNTSYLGFDCSHFGDVSPVSPPHPGATYKTYEFAIAETNRLARQIALIVNDLK